MMKRATFLHARWRYLAVLNYDIDAKYLLPLIPAGVELDLFEGRALISLVAFEFSSARLLGIPVPFHQLFPEINLRCYVKRVVGDDVRRGVVFLKEIVPCRAVVFVANRIFNESFARGKVNHSVRWEAESKEVTYRLELGDVRGSVHVCASGQAQANDELSFVLDRHFAYNVSRAGETLEYQVDRRPWQVWPATQFELKLDAETIYGAALGSAINHGPRSVALVDGSEVQVHRAHVIAKPELDRPHPLSSHS